MKRTLFILMTILLMVWVYISGIENSMYKNTDLLHQKIALQDSLIKIQRTELDSAATYNKELKHYDSIQNELIKMVYYYGYMKGVIDYRLFKEVLDSVKSFEIDSSYIDN